jgi:CO/xanthine dehydrogenase FAD-binding subunit
MREAEALLSGKDVTAARLALEAAGSLAGRAAEAVTDLHGTAEYKAHMVGVLLRRAFEQAYQQAVSGREGETR